MENEELAAFEEQFVADIYIIIIHFDTLLDDNAWYSNDERDESKTLFSIKYVNIVNGNDIRTILKTQKIAIQYYNSLTT